MKKVFSPLVGEKHIKRLSQLGQVVTAIMTRMGKEE